MIGFVRRGVRGRLLVVFALWTIVASGVFLCAPVVIGAASSRAAAADAPPHTARVCQDDIAAGVLQSTGAEAFLQLTVPAGAHVNIYGHIFLLSADVNGQYRTKFKLDQLDGDSSLNMTGEFEGGYYFFGQLNSHSVGWEFDNTGGERTATVRLSHEISNVLGWSLQVSYGSAPRPIDCGPVSSGESYGPNIALVNPCPAEGQCADPVSTRSGNWHMPLPGLTVPGRGPGLSFEIAYNSLAASVAGKAGNGWSTTLDMALKFNSNGSRTVVQETGSTVTFYPQGGGLAAPARFSAELTENTDGTFTYERKNFERFRFGSTGRLLSISDRNGNTTTLTYPSGSSTEATYMEDSSGRRLHFSWSGGRLQAVTDDLGSASGGPRSLELGYSSGKLTSFTDVANEVWTLTYDSSGRLSTFRKPRFAGSPAKAIETHYDGIGRVDWQEDELNNRTTIAYDVGNPGWTKITDPEGNIRMDRYLNGRRAEVVDGYGTSAAITTKYQYDHVTFGVVDRTDGRGNRWRASYDDRGNRLFEEDPLGRITRWEYNALDQVTMRSTGEVRTGATTTSTAGQVTDRATYLSDGNPLSVTRAHGTGVAALTQFVHGDAGHPEDITSVIDARNKTWTAQYTSGTGDVTAVTDPLGGKTTWAYNEVGWVTAAVSPKGNVSGANAAEYRTVFERNLRGQITEATSPLGDVVNLGYDDDGNLTSIETHLSTADTAPQTTTRGYDDAGRLVGVDEPGPGARAMEYDGNGDLTAQIDEAGVRTDYAYDPVRRVSQVTASGGKVTGYGYDAASNLVTITQPGSGSTCAGTKVNCITVSYDAAGQQGAIDYSDPSTPDVTAITYDALGRLSAQSAAGHTETWSWDAQHRITAHLDNNNRTTGYGWDAAGNLTSITYPGTIC